MPTLTSSLHCPSPNCFSFLASLRRIAWMNSVKFTSTREQHIVIIVVTHKTYAQEQIGTTCNNANNRQAEKKYNSREDRRNKDPPLESNTNNCWNANTIGEKFHTSSVLSHFQILRTGDGRITEINKDLRPHWPMQQLKAGWPPTKRPLSSPVWVWGDTVTWIMERKGCQRTRCCTHH